MSRLHRLREQRKEKALEKVSMCKAALERAENELQEARKAIRDYLTSARRKESDGMSGIIGKTLNHQAMNDFRSDMMLIAESLEVLRAFEKDAGEKRDLAKLELQKAKDVFRQLLRSAEKLSYVIIQEGRKSGSKALALSEAAEDDVQNRRKRSVKGA
ncbi:MAG: hypothetical protein HC850_06845 [Rhodomicrobium sp.]|nr:hypothetical protein [Rhodomicrobium sp.]